MILASRTPRAITLAIGLLCVAPLAALAKDRIPELSRTERKELWDSSIAFVNEIRDSGSGALSGVRVDESVDPRVAAWITEYRELSDTLRTAKTKDFDRYVELAKEDMALGRIRAALSWAIKAHANAEDPDAFMNSPWLSEFAKTSVEKAEYYRSKAKWNKAHAVYYELSELFEDNKAYEEGRQECLNIARLDAIYSEDGNWEEFLEGIDPRNGQDAIERIDRYYVERPDFRAFTSAGLDQLLLLCESIEIRETFEGLQDDFVREDFKRRLEARRKQVAEKKSFSHRDAKRYFRRTLEINDQTLQLPDELIVYEFMTGALESLDDFTSMIWPIEFREFDKQTRGDFVGVGISISGGSNRPVTVVSPLEDTPAFRAGIKADDVITHVNGEEIGDRSLNKVVQLITGPMGSKVTLTVFRESENREFDVTLERALVKIASVKGVSRDPEDPEEWKHIIDEELGVAYVRVNSFQENTVRDLRRTIHRSLDRGARGLILDLRFNPGGLMKSAVEMAQLFLSRDALVVYTKGLRDPQWQNPSADQDGPFMDLPLIVLVNEYSASASEIVSGALKDHDRAIIIGENTFGKFSVQKLMQLGRSVSHLKLTTARYYLPSGQSLHHEEGAKVWGVKPDVEIAVAPKEISRVMDMRRKSDVLNPPGSSDSETVADGDEGDESEEAAPAEYADPDQPTDDENADAESPADKSEEDADGKGETTDDGESDEDEGDEEAGDDDEEGDEDDDDPDTLEFLAEDPNELPEVDFQLQTAKLLMRLYLLGQSGTTLAVNENPGVGEPMMVIPSTKTKVEVRKP